MSRTSMMTIGKVWLTAGLASVLAACASMGPSASSAQWPTATDVVATAPAFTGRYLDYTFIDKHIVTMQMLSPLPRGVLFPNKTQIKARS